MSAIRPDLTAAWEARRGERHLLLACLGFMIVGTLLAMGSSHGVGREPVGDLLSFGFYGLSLAGLHLGLVALGHRGDQALVVTVAFLAGLGQLAQARMGSFAGGGTLVPGHLMLPAGVAVMLGAATLFMGGRYRALAQGLWFWAGLSLVLLLLVLVTGQRFRGAVFGVGLITPTELLKVSVVLFLAAFVERHARSLGRWHPRLRLVPNLEPLWRLALFWVLLAGLLLIQRDIGMVAILTLALLTVLVAGSGHWGYLGFGLGLAAGLGYLMLGVFEHGRRRIDAWLDPFQDPTGDGWQILQGLSGMHAGGLWGEGFGEGNPGYTPIAESDFIYTVIGEELGFVGCVVVIVFFLILFQRGLAIAQASRTAFGRLLAIGLTTVLAAQTFLNVAGVTKLIPLTGITLPLISHGGASLLTAFAALGLLLAVSDGLPAQTAQRVPRPRRQGRSGGDTPDAAPASLSEPSPAEVMQPPAHPRRSPQPSARSGASAKAERGTRRGSRPPPDP